MNSLPQIKTLTSAQLAGVQRIAVAAADCQHVKDLQHEVLRCFQEVFHAHSCAFILSKRGREELDINNYVAVNVEDSFVSLYTQHYYSLEPMPCGFNMPIPDTTVQTIGDVLSSNKLVEGEYYNDFSRPQGIHYKLVIYLRSAKQFLGAISIHRPRHASGFSAQERSMAQMLAPHLALALEKIRVADQLSNIEALVDTMALGLPHDGVLVLDDSLELVYMNDHAKGILSCGREEGKERSMPDLPATLRRHCEKLKQGSLLEEGQTSWQVKKQLDAQGFSCGLVCHVKPVPLRGSLGGFLICIDLDEPGRSLYPWLKCYGISRREEELVPLVCEGFKNTEIAETLFISVRTVESHLKSLYDKLGVKNRASMVCRVMKRDR